MISVSAPTSPPRRLSRMQLGILLREWRYRADISSKSAAEALEWDASKMTRVEKGSARISAAELNVLLKLYEVPEEKADQARELGKEARKRGRGSRVPDWGVKYAELEQGADEIKLYDGELIPGLIQTESYSRAVLSVSSITPAEDVDGRVTERTVRHQRLTADIPPRLWVVLGEAALHRLVGGPAVLCEQLRWLCELSHLRSVTLSILPFTAGEHAGLGTQFHILGFDNPPATFVYLEGLTDASYFDQPSHTDLYTLVFQRLLVAAANERESVRMLDRRIKELA